MFIEIDDLEYPAMTTKKRLINISQILGVEQNNPDYTSIKLKTCSGYLEWVKAKNSYRDIVREIYESNNQRNRRT